MIVGPSLFALLQLGKAVGTEVTKERAMVKLKCHDPSNCTRWDQAFESELNLRPSPKNELSH